MSLPRKKVGVKGAAGNDKKGGNRTPQIAAGKGKFAAVRLREFGHFRFDYISSCTHDLKCSQSCPLCKLASYSTTAFFAAEAEERKRNREESFKNRALLRIDLLSHWDRCQTLYYVDFEGNKCSQIYLSKSLLEALCNHEQLVEKYSTEPINFEYLERVLQRRNRMYEAGHLAALFIQARVRRYLTQRKVRRMLLNRFEYVAPTKHKGEFFVDTLKLRKLTRYPMLLKDEHPGTPRTIQRRLNYENNFYRKRLAIFEESLKKQQSEGSSQSFEAEEALVQFYTQLVVARDIAAVAMARLKKILSEEAGSKLDEFAVWVLPTAPSTAARQFGLALALETLPQLNVTPATPKTPSRDDRIKDDGKLRPHSRQPNSPAGGPPSAMTNSAGAPINPINRALQQLDNAIYEALCCKTPEDVVHKVLRMDLLPLFTSILNISQDDFNIWNGDIDYHRNATTTAGTNAITAGAVAAAGNAIPVTSFEDGDTTETTISSAHAWEVLPFGLQIRLYTPRSPAGYFRLFFYEDEFIGVSSASPWAFYPEVFKNKDQILNAVRKFAALPTTRAFVHDYMRNALTKKSDKEAAPTHARATGDGRRITMANPKGGVPKTLPPPAPLAKDPGTLFSPPDRLVFPPHLIEEKDARIPAPLHQLSDPQVVSLKEKYRFVSKLSIFVDRFKRAQANESRRATRSRQQSSRPTTQSGRHTVIGTTSAAGNSTNSLGSTTSSSTSTAPNLQAIRRNRTDGLLINMNVLLDTMHVQGALKGVSVYDLLCPPPITEAGAFLQPTRHPYLFSLHVQSVSINTHIKQRIQHPEVLPERKQSAQLLVIDVYVNLPMPKLPANPTAKQTPKHGSAFFDDNSSVDSSSSSAPPRSGVAATPAYAVDVHQVIGVFNCSSERSPPNLDTGLFSYDYFYQIYKERLQSHTAHGHNQFKINNAAVVDADQKSTASGVSGTTQNTNNPTGLKDRGWSTVDPKTGICKGRALLTTGREFQCLLLGAPPSTEYLQEILPKKVQNWLGWTPEEST